MMYRIEADCGFQATRALDWSPSCSCIWFCKLFANTSRLTLIVGISSGSSQKKSSISLSNASVPCSGVAGSSMIGSHFLLLRLASMLVLFPGRGRISGFKFGRLLSSAIGTGMLTICFSSGPGKASRALY
ncbi:hypothetical protein MtrunA17_Chr1g0198161 [Medicago truncatula]|uniref:Uncharacterized protein n=1 Tax=Medicago truncatula TaxID=3880 RepID=A0A396JX22_MEDTR|nr:hypothetical protein MtrunA17_Chr1g0198161 [Medicago truncatula]